MPSPFDPDPDLQDSCGAGAFTRRGFLQSALAAATIAEVPQALAVAPPTGRPERSAPAAPAQQVTLDINGQQRRMMLEPRVTLLDALRETAGLTGTKKGCDRGQCGACTVLLDGRRVNACLTLAVMAEGRSIVTVEGLANGEQLSPLQSQFIEQDAFQCGYCTPGQLCSATALIEELRAGRASAATADVRTARPPLTDDEIRERMSGNVCRCGAYPNIVRAIRIVAAGLA